MKYFTLSIPWVPDKYATKWHPTEPAGPSSVLTRGAFDTKAEAIDWGKDNLKGTPYQIKEMEY